jgi:hypothetical protein
MPNVPLTEPAELRADAPLVAYVLTRDVFVSGCPEIARALRERFGADASVMIDLDDGKEGAGGVLTVDGIGITLTPVPRPMPGDDELREIARSPRDPDGALARHAEHMIVGTIGKHVGHEATLKAALAVLKVCFILCECERASAVLWYLSRVMLDRETFMAITAPEALDKQPIPLGALVRFGTYGEEAADGTVRLGITGYGFRRFLGRDIEFEPSAVPIDGIAHRFLELALYLMEKGLIIKDGESWGWSADDVTRARYLDQGRLLPGPVVSLNLEKVDPAFTEVGR